ncbi:MAG: hypothetical protein FWC70_11675 [Defluviitaleaceae bacterium]|nr:hypothetical protein [Defluviitaleaceae bacterium]
MDAEKRIEEQVQTEGQTENRIESQTEPPDGQQAETQAENRIEKQPESQSVARKILRGVALGFQIAAIFMYFVVPLISGGTVRLPWLIFGVINTVVFCAIFYRDSGNVGRLVVGIILTVCTGIWCANVLFFMLVLSLIAGMYEWSGGVGVTFLYVFFAFAAAIFAVFVPRRQ